MMVCVNKRHSSFPCEVLCCEQVSDEFRAGLKYTCNAYSDSDCKNKVGEVYDCVSGSIGSISCADNGPL